MPGSAGHDALWGVLLKGPEQKRNTINDIGGFLYPYVMFY